MSIAENLDLKTATVRDVLRYSYERNNKGHTTFDRFLIAVYDKYCESCAKLSLAPDTFEGFFNSSAIR